MSVSFPASPTAGQIYQNWVWNASAGTWDAVSPSLTLQVKKQVFTASGTYTPSPGMIQCDIECVGGGGGGGASGSGVSQSTTGAGGGSGGYSQRVVTSTLVGASQVVTIGAGGAGGIASPIGNGTAGGDTSVGSLCVAKGGSGGGGNNAGVGQVGGAGGSGAAGTGDIRASGASGVGGLFSGDGTHYASVGTGGSSYFGGGAPGPSTAGTGTAGTAATGYGSGGGGGAAYNSNNFAGGNGSSGIAVITEYCLITQAAVAAQAASGARVLVSRQVVSTPVASVNFTGIDNSADIYELDVINALPSAGGFNPAIRYSVDGGATFDAGTGAYQYANSTCAMDGSGNSYNGGTSVYLFLGIAQYSQGSSPQFLPFCSSLRFYQPASTTNRRYAAWHSIVAANSLNGVGTNITGSGSWGYQAPGLGVAINALQFLFFGGNITAGTFNLWKVVR